MLGGGLLWVLRRVYYPAQPPQYPHCAHYDKEILIGQWDLVLWMWMWVLAKVNAAGLRSVCV